MFLETDPEGRIRKESADYHFADPEGLGKYAYFVKPSHGDIIPAEHMEQALLMSGRYRPVKLEGRSLFVTKDFYDFFKHSEEQGIEFTEKGMVVLSMSMLKKILTESREVLDNARLTTDGKTLYLIKNKLENIL